MTRARLGGVLGKLLLMLVVVSLAGALAWTTLANHRVSGQWSFHPLDPSWWSPQVGTQGGDPYADVAQDAQHLAHQAGEALWGPGGLIERCESWWHERGAPNAPSAPMPSPGATTPAPSATTPPAGAATPASAPSIRDLLEQRMALSTQRFSEGITQMKLARPQVGDDAVALRGRLVALMEARARFDAVERDLNEAIPAYEALPGHDPAKLANARQVLGFAHQMQELTRLSQ